MKHFAHPRGWEKGEPMVEGVSTVQSFSVRPVAEKVGGVRFLSFTTEKARKEWLRWWRKPTKM